MSNTQSPLDSSDVKVFITQQIGKGETNATIARNVALSFGLNTSSDSIRRFRKRHKINPVALNPAYTKVKGDEAEALTEPTTDVILDDPDKMLRERGLDPEEWVIDWLTANEYQGPASADHTATTGETKVTYYQTKFTAKKISPDIQIVAPRTDGWKAPVKRKSTNDKVEKVVIVGDQQAPFYDSNLHQCFLTWLEHNQPDKGVLLGDTVDFPNISRHKLDPENTARVNECLQSGYDLLRGYVEASPDTTWKKMPGNHDERIRNLLLDQPKTQALYGIKRADTPEREGEKVLEVPYLLRLDELDIEWVDPHGSYDMAQIDISPKLAVRHGWLARKDAGASAMESLKHTGYSILVGHTHRQGIVHQTTYDIHDYPTVLTAVETGCMCRLDVEVQKDGRRFPSYTPLPNWQQGFAVASVWPDGKFKVDLATYVNNTLFYQDQRYG